MGYLTNLDLVNYLLVITGESYLKEGVPAFYVPAFKSEVIVLEFVLPNYGYLS